MKTQNLLKLAFTMMAMVIMTGVMAQTHNGTAITGQANVAAYGQDAETYMVEGTTVPLYALPDPIYHSDWDYTAGVWTLTDGFVWNWVEATATLTFSQNAAEDNYVTITAPANSAVGSPYTVSVTEEAPAAYGSCEGAATNLIINVVETPAITLGALDGETPNFCAGDVGIPTAVNAAISGGWQNYRVAWTLEIATLGAGLTKDNYYSDETGAGANAVQFYAVENTEASPAAVAAAGNYDLMTVGSFAVIDNKPTVYTYQLTSINDQALRFGDFINLAGDATSAGAFTYNPYTGTTGTYTIQVNPAPTTGPIYHIPADWAN